MQFICLSSGSSGNCYILFEDDCGLIIDQGIGLRKFRKIVSQYNLRIDKIRALLLTHEHFDHSRSVGETSQLLNIPVFAHYKVHDAMLQNPHIYKKVMPQLRHDIDAGEVFEIGCFNITTIHVPHDSTYNLGFFIETPQTDICLMTDIGNYQSNMLPYISKARNLIIETNYDPQMLVNGKYPEMLKRRIATAGGHSSNDETAGILAENLSERIQRVFLCHLSANNNTPTLALHTVKDTLTQAGIDVPLIPLARTSPTGIFTI